MVPTMRSTKRAPNRERRSTPTTCCSSTRRGSTTSSRVPRGHQCDRASRRRRRRAELQGGHGGTFGIDAPLRRPLPLPPLHLRLVRIGPTRALSPRCGGAALCGHRPSRGPRKCQHAMGAAQLGRRRSVQPAPVALGRQTLGGVRAARPWLPALVAAGERITVVALLAHAAVCSAHRAAARRAPWSRKRRPLASEVDARPVVGQPRPRAHAHAASRPSRRRLRRPTVPRPRRRARGASDRPAARATSDAARRVPAPALPPPRARPLKGCVYQHRLLTTVKFRGHQFIVRPDARARWEASTRPR